MIRRICSQVGSVDFFKKSFRFSVLCVDLAQMALGTKTFVRKRIGHIPGLLLAFLFRISSFVKISCGIGFVIKVDDMGGLGKAI